MDTIQKLYKFANFINTHWPAYVKKPTKFILPEVYKAVNAIRVCRTARLGAHVYACPKCGDMAILYNSCKNRFCPTCAWKDTLKWVEGIMKILLKIKHRHVICSVPHALIPLIKKNRQVIHNMIFRASADTFKDWMLAKEQIKTGCISVLHTCGEKKNWHSHVHMIQAWGGINVNSGELQEFKTDYINYKFIRNKFRIKFEAQLIEAFDKDQIKHNFKNRIEFMLFIKSLNETAWQVQIEPPIKDLEIIVRYIGRYSKRACLSDSNITNIDGEFITFKYKDYRDRIDPEDKNSPAKVKELTLHFSKFFPLLLQHVPPSGFQMVRRYGIYANSSKIADKHRNKKQESKSEKQEQLAEYKNPTFCEYCNIPKIHLISFFEKMNPVEGMDTFDDIMRKCKLGWYSEEMVA